MAFLPNFPQKGASLQQPYDHQILFPIDLFEFAKENIQGIQFEFISSGDIHIKGESKAGGSLIKSCEWYCKASHLHSTFWIKDKAYNQKIGINQLMMEQLVSNDLDKLLFQELKMGTYTCIFDNEWWV